MISSELYEKVGYDNVVDTPVRVLLDCRGASVRQKFATRIFH